MSISYHFQFRTTVPKHVTDSVADKVASLKDDFLRKSQYLNTREYLTTTNDSFVKGILRKLQSASNHIAVTRVDLASGKPIQMQVPIFGKSKITTYSPEVTRSHIPSWTVDMEVDEEIVKARANAFNLYAITYAKAYASATYELLKRSDLGAFIRENVNEEKLYCQLYMTRDGEKQNIAEFTIILCNGIAILKRNQRIKLGMNRDRLTFSVPAKTVTTTHTLPLVD